MPSEDTTNKESNLKIIALVAIFLIVALVAVLFYYQSFQKENKTEETTTSKTTTSTTNDWVTYTSKTHGYSISYPKTWQKVVAATSTNASGPEIILLNLTDNEGRDNGKPNIIITAGAPADVCSEIKDQTCRQLGNNVFASIQANGDQALVDKVLNTFETN